MDLLSQQLADTAEQAVGTAMWTGKTWVKWLHHGGRTWVKWQPHGGRTWEDNWGALQAAEIIENMGEKVPHYVLKSRRSWVSLTAHIFVYK